MVDLEIDNMKERLIGLIVSIGITLGSFGLSHELMMSSVAFPKGSGPEAYFAITSIIAFLVGLVALIAVCYLLWALIFDNN